MRYKVIMGHYLSIGSISQSGGRLDAAIRRIEIMRFGNVAGSWQCSVYVEHNCRGILKVASVGKTEQVKKACHACNFKAHDPQWRQAAGNGDDMIYMKFQRRRLDAAIQEVKGL